MARIKLSPLTFFPIVITTILFIIGFFWVQSGFMDLGGDSSRLYFYDPINYLKAQSLYSVSPSLLGGENFSYYGIPFLLFLAFLKSIFQSPSLLISVFYGASLSLAFVFVYKILREILGVYKERFLELCSVLSCALGGLYYVFSPTSILNWGHNISTYNQVFLNPMMFYFLLRFLETKKRMYVGILLGLTILFSNNFSVVAAPPILSFYPLALLYLYAYIRIIKGQTIPWKDAILGFMMFLGIHLFQFLPTVLNIFSPVSPVGNAIFSTSGKIDRGLGYFSGLTNSVKVSLAWIGLPQLTKITLIGYAHIVFPSLFFVALLKHKSKPLLLTAIFFCIALFWETANITNTGASFYKSLFVIPGFAMFRNYYAQFTYVFLFFYVLLLGQSLFIVFSRIKEKFVIIITVSLTVLLMVTAWPLINGSIVNSQYPSSETKTVFRMDPSYERVLSFFRSLPKDGKIMLLPLTDYGYQVLSGMDEKTAYVGPSTISYLTGKQDFAGTQELETWKDQIMYLVRTKKYEQFKKLIGMMGVKYIFYNSDPAVYSQSFLNFPFTEVKKYFPPHQEGYKAFINDLGLIERLNIDNKYFIYELDDDTSFPEVYATTNSIYFDREITDWTIPLSLEIMGTMRPVIYQKGKPSSGIASTIYQAVPKDQWNNLIKNQTPELVLHNSFSTTSPYSLLYPLITLKEDLARMNYFRPVSDDLYIDKRLFFSAKRIFELEKFGPTLSAQSGWEWNIDRYAQNMQENIVKIHESQQGGNWKTRQKFLVNEYLQLHRVRLKRALKGASKTKEEYEHIFNHIDDTFSLLINNLAFPALYTNELTYEVDMPKSERASYDVLIPKQLAETYDITLTNSNFTLKNASGNKRNDWHTVGSFATDDSKEFDRTFQLTIDDPIDVMKSAVSTTSSIITEEGREKIVDVDATLYKGLSGIFWNIVDWLPNSYYLLSFEYQTKGKEFNLKVYDVSLDYTGNKEYSALIKDSMATDRWTSYQGIVKSSPYAVNANIGIVPWLDSGGSYALDLRNVSFVQAPITPILFKKSAASPVYSEPTIEFTKVNPTKYFVSVHNAIAPYTLVLNESYNTNWTVHLSDQTKNSWLYDILPRSEKSFVDVYHFTVNGYANGWQITPVDVNDAKNYTLVIEMESQRTFYKSLAISLIFFIVYVFYFVVVIWKKR